MFTKPCTAICRKLLRDYQCREGQPVRSKGEAYCRTCKIIFFKPDFVRCPCCENKLRMKLLIRQARR